MNRVTINGTTIVTSGRSISVVGNKVIIDGKEIDLPDAKQINISVEGSVEKLEVDVCEKISVTGNVGNLASQSGDVEVAGNVSGSIQTMSGDVRCGAVGGNISTMSGDVKNRG